MLAMPPRVFASPTIAVQATSAPQPFDDGAAGDCILRSREGVNFRVFKIILTLASPVFKSMFALPQPATSSSEQTGDLPVINVAENVGTLLNLLLLLYPATAVKISTYEQAVELIEVYDKYDIRIESLHPFLHDALLSPDGLEKDPLGVYSLAWRLGLKGAAQNASRYLHTVDLNDEEIKRDLLARSGDINSLLALWDLRYRRERALDQIVAAVQLASFKCSTHRPQADNQSNVCRLRDNARSALNVPHPACRDLRHFLKIEDLVTAVSDSPFSVECPACREKNPILTAPKSEREALHDAAIVAAFPQVVEWTSRQA